MHPYLQRHPYRAKPLSSAEALVFLGFNITMRYISLHFTWRILEHERSRWAKERRRQRKRVKASAEKRGAKLKHEGLTV